MEQPRLAIESALTVTSSLRLDAEKKVLRTILLRGRRLAHSSRGDMATTLAMFTNVLPCDREVPLAVFEGGAECFRNKQRMS